MSDDPTVYVKNTSEAQANLFSQITLSLSNPDPAPGTVTDKYCTIIKHPERDEWAMVWNLENRTRIHPDCPENAYDPLLVPLRDAGYVTQAEIDLVHNVIKVGRGGTLFLYPYFPNIFKVMTLTHEEAVADGWVVEDDEE